MASSFKHIAQLSGIAAALACFGIPVAQASYTVIDDDLLPTAVVEARKQSPADQFDVPFAKNAIVLGPLGRRTLEEMAPSLQGAAIKIIGRPDALSGGKILGTDGTTLISLAAARTNALRQYFLRQGIPASSITTATDDSPNPQTNGSIYPSQIVITRTSQNVLPSSSSMQARPAEIQTTQAYAPAPAALPPLAPAPKPNPLTNTLPSAAAPDRDQLIQFINQSVQSGAMDASVALTLMSRLLNDTARSNNKTPQPAPATATATPTPPPPVVAQPAAPAPAPNPLFVATPSLARKTSWALDKSLTLRDNVNAWSSIAGWKPSQWDASNYFQVTASSTIEGGFPDVLRQIADSTGLNICARKHEKYIRVTDAGIPCDK